MPVQIFVHEKRLINPYTGDTVDDFTHIASPLDLLLYPVGAPDATQFPAFFRKAVVDFLVPSQAAAAYSWEAIQEQVCLLVDALDALDVLSEIETTRCGGDLEESESASESESA